MAFVWSSGQFKILCNTGRLNAIGGLYNEYEISLTLYFLEIL